MRRGLMAWDKAELPVEALQARNAELRSRMQAEGIDALLAYTNIARPAAVSWISGFTPYWSEGLYLLPLQGEPVFATALSKRVAEWIGTVMPVGKVVPTPRPAAVIAELLKDQGTARLGIVDLDDLPAHQALTLSDHCDGVELSDATQLFNAARAPSDASERALFAKAAGIAQACMSEAVAIAAKNSGDDARALIAACELRARREGAEDVFISVIADLSSPGGFRRTDTIDALGIAFALRFSLAYKGVWVRIARLFTGEPDLERRFEDLQRSFDEINPGAAQDTVIEFATRTAPADATSTNVKWSVEQPRGSYPLVTVADHTAVTADYCPGAPGVLSLETRCGDVRWIAAKPLHNPHQSNG